jgi:hypothetical protein
VDRQTRYAKTDDGVYVAQVVGDGPVDRVFVMGVGYRVVG